MESERAAEEELSYEPKLPQLWSWALCIDRKHVIEDSSWEDGAFSAGLLGALYVIKEHVQPHKKTSVLSRCLFSSDKIVWALCCGNDPLGRDTPLWSSALCSDRTWCYWGLKMPRWGFLCRVCGFQSMWLSKADTRKHLYWATAPLSGEQDKFVQGSNPAHYRSVKSSSFLRSFRFQGWCGEAPFSLFFPQKKDREKNDQKHTNVDMFLIWCLLCKIILNGTSTVLFCHKDFCFHLNETLLQLMEMLDFQALSHPADMIVATLRRNYSCHQ